MGQGQDFHWESGAMYLFVLRGNWGPGFLHTGLLVAGLGVRLALLNTFSLADTLGDVGWRRILAPLQGSSGHSRVQPLDNCTANTAALHSLLQLLNRAYELNLRGIHVAGDSIVAVRYLRDRRLPKTENLKRLYLECRRLADRIRVDAWHQIHPSTNTGCVLLATTGPPLDSDDNPGVDSLTKSFPSMEQAIRQDIYMLAQAQLDTGMAAQSHVSNALEFASGKGLHEAVRSLLPEVIGEDGYNPEDRVLSDLERLAVTAAGSGYYEVVDLLLTEIIAEREDEHEGEFVYYGYEQDIEDNKNSAAWHVLDAAAEAGHVDIVELAAGRATEDDYMPARERSEALTSAISGGHAAVVEFLLECDQFQWDELGAFDQAVNEDQHDIAKVIYDLYPRCNNGADLFVHLAGAGCLKAVEYLYDKAFSTSKSVGEAFVSTMPSNHTAVANFLLDTDLVSAAAFGMAFKKAALNGWIESVEFLFSKGRVSPQSVNKVFGKMTKIKVLKLLAKTQRITTEAIVTAFRNATSKGYFGGTDTEAILRFLYKQSCIPPEVYAEGFLCAVKESYGGDAMAKLLCDESRISADVLRTAFKTAADTGHAKMVEFLFDKPAITQEINHEAMVRAAQNDQDEVVQLLGRCGEWPKDFLTRAYKATRRQVLKRFLREKLNASSMRR